VETFLSVLILPVTSGQVGLRMQLLMEGRPSGFRATFLSQPQPGQISPIKSNSTLKTRKDHQA